MIRPRILRIVFFLTAFYSFATEVQVPDLESRIRNSGNSIPENALPILSSPRPSELPDAPASLKPLVEPDVIFVSDIEVPAGSEIIEAEPFFPLESSPSIMGSALLGAGAPGSIRGELSLIRGARYSLEDTLPALALDFFYDSADGYGLKKPGTGFFDRSVHLAGVISSGDRLTSPNTSWLVGLDLSERTDGFQGLNPLYYSINTRSVSWDSSYTSAFLSSDLFSWGVAFSGSSLSAFADRPGANSSSPDPTGLTFIPDANRYDLLPSLNINFRKELSGKTIPGFIAASLSGNYSFTGMADPDEFHQGGGDLSVAYRYKRIETALLGAILYDSESGLLFPFSGRFLYENIGSFLSRLSVEGGLSSTVSDPAEIRFLEPFARTDLLPRVLSDWFGSMSFNLSPVQTLSLGSTMTYKKTAFSRRGFYLTTKVQENGLLNIEQLDRDSFSLLSELVWRPSFFSLSFAHSGEFLDSLYRTNLHYISFGAEVFDTGVLSKWKAGVKSRFSLDSSDIPFLDMYGTFKPARNVSIICTVKDAIPPLFGKNRDRWGGYIARSGEILLSARLDF